MVGSSAPEVNPSQCTPPQPRRNKNGWLTSISASKICWRSPGRRRQWTTPRCGCLTGRPTPACTARRPSSPWSTGGITAENVAKWFAPPAPPRGSSCPPSLPNPSVSALHATTSSQDRDQDQRPTCLKKLEKMIHPEKKILMMNKMKIRMETLRRIPTGPASTGVL